MADNIKLLKRCDTHNCSDWEYSDEVDENIGKDCAIAIRALEEQVKGYDELALYIIKFAIPQYETTGTYLKMFQEIKEHTQTERLRIKTKGD